MLLQGTAKHSAFPLVNGVLRMMLVAAASGRSAHAAGQINGRRAQEAYEGGTERVDSKWICRVPQGCRPSANVLNRLRSVILGPTQGGWKWGKGWRGHKCTPFCLKTEVKSYFNEKVWGKKNMNGDGHLPRQNKSTGSYDKMAELKVKNLWTWNILV